MSNTVAIITFTDLPIEGDKLKLNAYNPDVPMTPFGAMESFQTLRDGLGKATIGADINETAQNYVTAFSFDYPGFIVDINDNVVTVSIDLAGDYTYFIDYVLEGDFATVNLIEQAFDITVTGLEGNRYLINNEINIVITANQSLVYFKTIVQNLYNQKTSTSLITYPDSEFSGQLGLQAIIKSLFEYPVDAQGELTDEVVPNLNKYKISVYYNPADEDGNPTAEVLGFQTAKYFIRGGKRTTQTNQTLSTGIITPTDLLPVWSGYDSAEYYIDQTAMRKRFLADVSLSRMKLMRSKGCNETYVKFLNQNGGYSTWLFESHVNTENNTNQGGFIRNNEVDDLGNETDFKLSVSGKVPKEFKQLMLDLIISPEIYAVIDGVQTRVRSGRNSMQYDNIKRAYQVNINFEVDNRFNPSLTWSN